MNDKDMNDKDISRRRMLGLVAGGAVAGTAGLVLPATAAGAHGDIQMYSGVWGQRTVYEVTGNLTSFGYRPSFHDRCNTWLEFWYLNTPSNFLQPLRVWSLGVHVDNGSEAHENGRGFDLTRIYTTINGSLAKRFDGRHNVWGGTSSAATERVRYWATSASLHYHFRDVLTYEYNSAHDNHIHFDNTVSGSGNSFFVTSSKAQVVNVQACCRWIWGKGTAIDGIWGPETNGDSHDVLVRIGEGGYLTGAQSKWLAFNRASCRKGYGTQSY